VARALPEALAGACARALDADDSYVFIDRLEVECSIACHWPDDVIAEHLAARIAQALALERQVGDPLVFRDRPELLSAFFGAVIDGHVSGPWWFAEFGGLAPLPVSTRLRTLILEEREHALVALARLPADRLHRVLSALSNPDIERILAAIVAQSGGEPAPTRTLIAAARASWRDALRAHGHGYDADALAAFLALSVVAHALLPERPVALHRDSALRRVFGVPDRHSARARESRAALSKALATTPPEAGSAGSPGLGEHLRALARALIAQFGNCVPGCSGSSAEYLRRQCLSFGASSGEGTAARLGRAPLDILLVFSGLKRASLVLPDGRPLVLAEEELS
jgi:hypothetical protein